MQFSISKWHCTQSVVKLICFKWFNRLFTIWCMASCHPCVISVFSNELILNAMIHGVHPPRGVVDQWMGWGWAWGYVGVAHVHTHAHAHMHMHVKHAKHGCLHVGGHLQFLYMYKCACMCVCMCVGTPPCPQMPPIHPPSPQSRREPKTPKFNKS